MFDKVKSEGIRRGLNVMLNGRYGEVQKLTLDSKARTIDLQAMLNGESEPIDIRIGRYELDVSDEENPTVSLHDVQVSRQWMQEIAHDQVEGQKVVIPPNLKSVVKMVL